ncbi:hypothetical protein D7X87_11605 [bacterium D16-54]|nr:hypothetical protein D7X87_11605 [bacterium D16-54]RKJ14395.1 hypothetical protein D7X65_12200 [bacterium D16-56]
MNIVSLIISICSFIISAINLYMYIKLTSRYNDMVSTQTLTAQGAFETQIRSLISDATKELTHYSVELQRSPDNTILQQAYYTAEEQYRNAYEEACGKYIDNKIDKIRFEKLYKQEIYKLVNDENQKQFYATNQSTYASTISVYKEWFSQA